MDIVSLIYKVLSGQADEGERKALDTWVSRSEGNRREFEDIRLLWENSVLEGIGSQHDHDGFNKIKLRLHARLRRNRQVRALLVAVVAVTSLVMVLLLIFR